MSKLLSIVFFFAILRTVFSAPSRDKPNFIFVITDDQRWDAMGVVQREQGAKARFPWFESPAMDRLASEGVRFRNAFVPLSLCSPSRAAFLTGQYAHKNGIRKNMGGISPEHVTHATLLRSAGYQTAYFGKWHMRHQRERPGFDYYASFIGQGKYQDWDFEVNGETVSTTGWIDDVTTTLAIDWLEDNKTKPFSMVIGYKSPHNHRGGENLPPRLQNLYEGETGRAVASITSPAVFHQHIPEEERHPHRFVQNELQLDYFRHVKGIDENLGRLLDALDTWNLTENTVVVFTSDNGYFLGEHNLGDKRALYEESIRIPMLVRYPPLFPAGLVVDEMVLNVDLAPTYLDIAGLAVPEAMQGRSWKSLAAGTPVKNWRDAFVAHYYKELGDTPTCVALRTDTKKLVVYPRHPEWTEIYNLVDDPYEIRNLAADITLQNTLRRRLDEELAAIELDMLK